MIELQSTDFYRVRSLFEPLMAHQMFCAGVLDGLYPGRVFVDDLNKPQSAFITQDGVWWFLAGDPRNAAFNQTLNTALFNRTMNGERSWGGMLVCHPADWDAQIPLIFAPHIPITTQRLHYTCQQLKVDWRSQIPDGFEIRFIDLSLIDDGIEVHGSAGDILKTRQETLEPDRKAMGYVAIHNREIVASSVINCIVNKGGDIGLFTNPEHRRRNLAYLTSAAVIEYALSHGLEVVHWNCESFNAGSIRTANKLGLQFSHTHSMYILILNPVRHELNRAWSHFDAGHYEQAIAICQQSNSSGNAPVHPENHYIVARCQLAMGKSDEAALSLEVAAQSGWDSLDEMLADFLALTSHPSWQEIVGQVQKNALVKHS